MSLVASHAADGEIRSSNKALRILRWAAVLVIAVGFAFPLYWVLVTAFNSHPGVFRYHLTSCPPFMPMHFSTCWSTLAGLGTWLTRF